MSDNFDPVAVVVDWLDACRARDLTALLEFYAQNASLECGCDGRLVHRGRAELESYWRPRLDDFSPTAFGLQDITPAPDGVVLDYSGFEGLPVRVFFAFDGSGKILQMRCERPAQNPPPSRDH